MSAVVLATFTSCEDEQQFTNENTDARRIEVSVLPDNLAKVRDYVPLYAVAAHRGSIFWTPEETEASWRWAREMGADYLESDMQATKDGIVLANHDENLKRTPTSSTSSATMFPPPARTSTAASRMPTATRSSQRPTSRLSISVT